MNYSEKLKDPRWQKKRLEVFQRHGFKCCLCDAEDKTLHIHHGFYEWNREPWEADITTLWPLCGECHENMDCIRHDMRLALARCTPFSLEMFANTICCMNDELRDKLLFKIATEYIPIFLKTYGDQERANAEPHPA